MSKEYSYWLHDALGSDHQPVETLNGDVSVDVAIVGGGFTGLWSAILLKQKQPDLTVAVLEKGRCGSGASGYNGGCLLTWATKYPTLKKLFGQTEAQWLVKESEAVISEIREFCEEYKVDAELFTNGTYYTATNQAQSGTMDPVVAALEAENVNSWANVAPESLPLRTGSKVHKEAFYSPAAGSVQPAKLARGLMRVAKELGVQVYENTPMLSLDDSQPAVVTTETGRVKAKNVIFATNAWLIEQFPEFKRSIVVVSSDMVLTKPVEGKLAEFGPEKGVTVVDSRIFVHYYRDTKDGRLMLGKGGNRFSFGNKVDGMFHSTSRYLTQLESSFSWLFPYLNKSDIAHSWTGGSDRSVTGLPFFDRLRGHPHIFYGLGYSGNGVAQTRIGAKILSSMVLKEDNAYTQCGLAKGPRGYFPPEPFRWCGAMMVRNAVRRKESAEQKETTPLLIDRWLSKLAGAAGKADKL